MIGLPDYLLINSENSLWNQLIRINTVFHYACKLGVTIAAKNDYCDCIDIAGSNIAILYYYGLPLHYYCDTIV